MQSTVDERITPNRTLTQERGERDTKLKLLQQHFQKKKLSLAPTAARASAVSVSVARGAKGLRRPTRSAKVAAAELIGIDVIGTGSERVFSPVGSSVIS